MRVIKIYLTEHKNVSILIEEKKVRERQCVTVVNPFVSVTEGVRGMYQISLSKTASDP